MHVKYILINTKPDTIIVKNSIHTLYSSFISDLSSLFNRFVILFIMSPFSLNTQLPTATLPLALQASHEASLASTKQSSRSCITLLISCLPLSVILFISPL